MKMNKSQKRGVVFFSVLALLILGMQLYGFFVKGDAFEFEMIVMSISLILFCYFYPIQPRA